MVEAAMGVVGVVGVEMVEAAGRVEEPATAAAAPVLLAALVMALGVPGLAVLVNRRKR